MHLWFDQPADSEVIHDRGWTVVQSTCWRVLLTPIVAPSAIDPHALIEDDLPEGATCEWLSVAEQATRSGWPMTLVALRVLDAEQRVFEYRLAAVYKLLAYVAVACARIATGEAYERDRAALLDLFASVRPEFAGAQVACIEDWYAREAP